MSLKAIFKNLSVLVLSFTVANLSLAQDGEGQTLQAKQHHRHPQQPLPQPGRFL